MKTFKAFFVCTVALILQSSLLQWSILSHIHPDLVLLVVVMIGFRYGPIMGVFCGFYTGLLQDIYAIETLGIEAFTKSMTGYLIGLINEKRFLLTPMSKILLLGLAIVIHDLITYMFMGLNFGTITITLYSNTMPVLIFTLLIALPVFYFSNKSERI